MKKRRISYHIIGWLIIGLTEYTVYPNKDGVYSTVFFATRMLLFIGLFYYNSELVFPMYAGKRRVKAVLVAIGGAAVYAAVFYLLFKHLYYLDFEAALSKANKQMGNKDNSAALAMRGMLGVIVIYYFVLLFGAMFYWLQRSVRIAKGEAARLENEKLQDEFEKIRLQNLFLRSQINPHFLHNTLNFFYAKLLPVSPELSDGILTLSNVMRYSLQQEEDERGMVYLDKEIEHLQNVIAIHQMRFSNNLNIDFTVEGDTDGVKLIPLVFITLVENGFKHGHLTDGQAPLTIRLEVGDEILFRISNRKKTGPREISHGIGIDNIRKRLEYVYKTDYSFEINDGGGFYQAELHLPLIKK
ncbi:MAG: hypothetical protein EOO09_12620 [Chitinophagaceae bacterium]|nr:MAG: hypothetical protein EOO09_12620 [Chitinophagaceae bacterium]